MKIKLTKGHETEIDKIDKDLASLNWCVKPHHGNFYAHHGLIKNGKWTTETMHHAILERMLGRPLRKGEMTDHADGNGLNNTRANLRIANNSLNKINGKKYTAKPTTSKFKGVHWIEKESKWRARISKDNERISLGLFEKEEDAARAYNKAAEELFGKRAKLNKV